MEIIEELENGKIVLKVDKSLYCQEAILNTTYKFTDTCYIHIASMDLNNYGVYVTPKNSATDVKSVMNEFLNELIDQQIRHNLAQSNNSIKELIIKKAFFPFQENG
jgi:His-Xaa-Ser system protein HxsD